MDEYIQDQWVDFWCEFTDDGTPADPDDVRFRIWPPDATTYIEYTTADTGEMVRGDVGSYRVRLRLDTPGAWAWRWDGIGEVDASVRGWTECAADPLA